MSWRSPPAELRLDHGALQALDARAFARCPRLHTLDLRGNQLDALPPLQAWAALRRLRRQGNPLWCGCRARPLLEAGAGRGCAGTCWGQRALRGGPGDAPAALGPALPRGSGRRRRRPQLEGQAPRALTVPLGRRPGGRALPALLLRVRPGVAAQQL